jgi:flagellar hook-associated protein 1 FlgK
MGNLLVSLLNSANALSVYNDALATTENNVLNASTPDYARQVQVLTALPFDLSSGMPGGVGAGPVISTRDAYAEESVRTQQSQLGYQQQISTDLGTLQNYFDPQSTSGISTSLEGLFNSFSQLSVNPNDTVSRQAVLDQAQQVAASFQTTATGIGTTSGAIENETQASVQTINQLASQIAQINTQSTGNGGGAMNAGVDASLNSDLEELSQYAGFKALQQPDGQVTVYLGGQAPLVIGDTAIPLQTDFSSGQTRILDAQGNDITSEIQSGSLAGLLQENNTLLPSYLSDLNTLAQSVADQVNTTLSNGIDQNGNTPTTDLFAYDATAGAAASLTVNPLTPDQIAAALPGAPGGNGNALALAQLTNATPINGFSFAQYYGNISANVGSDLSNAQSDATTDQQLLTQAQTLRSTISGVSLDQEATNLITYQRAYDAVSKMVTVIDAMTEDVINMIPTT